MPASTASSSTETDAVLQFCWAHLIRDVKFLTTLPDAVTCRFGEKLLGKIKVLFRLWHRRETTPAGALATGGGACPARDSPHGAASAAAHGSPESSPSDSATTGAYYFTFLERPGVEPTNNGMEQTVPLSGRSIARSRKARGAKRDVAGANGFGPRWRPVPSVAAARSSILCEAIDAYFRGQAGPSLLAMPP